MFFPHRISHSDYEPSDGQIKLKSIISRDRG